MPNHLISSTVEEEKSYNMGNRHSSIPQTAPTTETTKGKQKQPKPDITILQIDQEINTEAAAWTKRLLENNKYRDITIVVTGTNGTNYRQFVEKFCAKTGFQYIGPGEETMQISDNMMELRKVLEKADNRNATNNALAFLARYVQLAARDGVSMSRDREMIFQSTPKTVIRVLCSSIADEMYVRLITTIQIHGMSKEMIIVAEAMCKCMWAAFANQYDLATTLFVYVRPNETVWNTIVARANDADANDQDIKQMKVTKQHMDRLYVENAFKFCNQYYTMILETDIIDLSSDTLVTNAKLKICSWIVGLIKERRFGLPFEERVHVLTNVNYADGRHIHITSTTNRLNATTRVATGIPMDDSLLSHLASGHSAQEDFGKSASDMRSQSLIRHNSGRSHSSSSGGHVGSASSSPDVYSTIHVSNPGRRGSTTVHEFD